MKSLSKLLQEVDDKLKVNKPIETKKDKESTEVGPSKNNPADNASTNIENDKLKKVLVKRLEESEKMDDIIILMVQSIGEVVERNPDKILDRNNILYYLNLLRKKIYNITNKPAEAEAPEQAPQEET